MHVDGEHLHSHYDVLWNIRVEIDVEWRLRLLHRFLEYHRHFVFDIQLQFLNDLLHRHHFRSEILQRINDHSIRILGYVLHVVQSLLLVQIVSLFLILYQTYSVDHHGRWALLCHGAHYHDCFWKLFACCE